MAGVMLWDGEKLLQGAIALAVFDRQPHAESVQRVVVLGAAASGTANVILRPTDFGPFLQQHREAILVCYDAAKLHWLLEDHFSQFNGKRPAEHVGRNCRRREGHSGQGRIRPASSGAAAATEGRLRWPGEALQADE